MNTGPTLNLPKPEQRQIPILMHPARFKVLCAGRRFGKTTMGIIAAIYGHGPIVPETGLPRYPGAAFGKKIWWAAPTTKNFNDVWRDLKEATYEIWTDRDANGNRVQGGGEKSEQENRIAFPGGGSITVRSTEIFSNLRGPGVDGMLLDEAAFMDGRAWYQVLRPMLADRQGWAIFYSTPSPKPANWFEKLHKGAQTPSRQSKGWMAFRGISTDNPRFTKEELEEIESDPEYSYSDIRREYYAEFVSQGSSKFKEEWIREFTDAGDIYLVNDEPVDKSSCFRLAVMDLATSVKKRSDFTVVQVWDVTPKNDMLMIHQFRDRIEGPQHLPLLHEIYKEFQPAFIGIEKSGYQLSLVQAAIQEGLPIEELNPRDDKTSRADTLAARMAQGKVFYNKYNPYWNAYLKELLSFPSGHDDQVDASAYAAIRVAQRLRTMLLEKPTVQKAMTLPMMVKVSDGLPIVYPRDLQTLYMALRDTFIGNGSWAWHVHVSRRGANASMVMGRISEWRRNLIVIDNRPITVEVPYFELPFHVKLNDENLSESLIADFIITMKQARKFHITSFSTRGIESQAAISKLERAGVGYVNYRLNEQAFSDVKVVFNEQRIVIPADPLLEAELTQIDESGKSLLYDDTGASAVAGVVGCLSKYGHQELYDPGVEAVDINQIGLGIYQGLNY